MPTTKVERDALEAADKAERSATRSKNKLNKLLSRSKTVGGVLGGAALGALADEIIGDWWGVPTSAVIGGIGIGAVAMDWFDDKNDETVLTLALGMTAPHVYSKTRSTLAAADFLSGLFGGNGNGNGTTNGNGGEP